MNGVAATICAQIMNQEGGRRGLAKRSYAASIWAMTPRVIWVAKLIVACGQEKAGRKAGLLLRGTG